MNKQTFRKAMVAAKMDFFGGVLGMHTEVPGYKSALKVLLDNRRMDVLQLRCGGFTTDFASRAKLYPYFK